MGEYLSENISRSFQDMTKPLSYTELADRVIKELSTSSVHKKNMTRVDLNALGCGLIFERKHSEGIFYFRTTHDFAKK
jgi:uncharacterized protein YkwD